MKLKQRLCKNGLFFLAFLFNQLLFAQARTVSGKVTVETGAPIVGVTVEVNSKQLSTTSSNDGSFLLSNVQTGDVVIFSSVGWRYLRCREPTKFY